MQISRWIIVNYLNKLSQLYMVYANKRKGDWKLQIAKKVVVTYFSALCKKYRRSTDGTHT
jgi:hypothetical protein